MTDVLRVGHPGGLCNRLDVIATACVLAEQRGIGSLEVMWPVNEHMPARFDELFESLPQGRVVPGEWDSAESRAYDEMRDALPSDFRSGSSYHSHLTRLATFVIPSIQQEAERAAASIDPASGVVGVHIRRAETPLPISPFAQPLRYYEAVMRAFPRSTRFFVSTDSAEAYRWLEARFGGRVSRVEKPRDDRHSVEGVREALVDLLVLSRCAAIIGTSRSSFSHVAGLLGRRPTLFLEPAISIPAEWPAFSRLRWAWAQRHFFVESTFWKRWAYYRLRPTAARRLRSGWLRRRLNPWRRA